MLHKDEYNQEEYNSYYEQETRGADILGKKDNDGEKKNILLILLLILLMAIGGYFGWKSMSSPDTTAPKAEDKKQKVIETESREIESVEKPNEKEIVRKEVEAVTNSSKMNPEDIANIVQMVMQKMNKENRKETQKDSPIMEQSGGEDKNREQNQESKLINSLKDTEVDLLSSEGAIDGISKSDSNKKATVSDKKTDTYNKVIISKDKQGATDELSRLSNELSNVIDAEGAIKSDSSEYTDVVKKEVRERKKEMRYVIVKKGDTLGKIAKRVYGNVMDYKKIYEANPDILRRPDRIYIGQKLRVPE
jgi:nucleoid-associated protein YgaU